MNGTMRAAWGLPFLLGAAMAGAGAGAQTSGLPAPMSGDCVTSPTGAVTCTKTNGVALAPSATTDATNAANITSGTLPVAQVPVLTGAKLPAGSAGTVVSYNASGVQTPAATQPYVATVGPIKVAPFNVSAPTSAGTLIGPYSTTGYRVANITNGARLLTTGQVSQVKTWIANTTGATALYFELWRVNNSGTFNLACRSQNLLSSVTNNALNTLAITGCNGQAGDYPAMYLAGTFSGQVTTFSASTTYGVAAYPTYYANGALLSQTEDFLAGTTGTTYGTYYNVPIEVYLAKGPVLVGLGDSKMQGIPFSGNYLQAGYNGTWQFPVAAQTNYSMASLGTSLIDLSNQPIAWAARTLGYSYANVGITGSTSAVQLAQALPTALALKPAVLVISGTINDSAFSVPTSTSSSNYQSMYTQAIAAGVQKVVMTGVEPAGAISEAVWSSSSVGADALNASLKAFCQAQTQCVWIGDAVSSALGQYRAGGAAGSMHNIQPGYAAADNLHFNNAGAQVMGLLEANAIEAPTAVGTTVAVANSFGTAFRARNVVAVSHDGTLGWRWQDTRDFLQVDTQGLDGAPTSAGAGSPGQQAVGCVEFAAGKGYVRCDGALTWSQQSSALSAANVSAGAMFVRNAFSAPTAASLPFGALYAYGDPAYANGPGLEAGQWGVRPLPLNLNLNYSGGVKVGGYVSVPHVIGSSGVPAVAVGAAAASCTIAGTDLAFTLTCTTGTAPAAGALATVTFATAYTAAPHFAAPGAVNAASAAAGSGLFASTTTAALTVSTANALVASTSYAWHFVLVQ